MSITVSRATAFVQGVRWLAELWSWWTSTKGFGTVLLQEWLSPKQCCACSVPLLCNEWSCSSNKHQSKRGNRHLIWKLLSPTDCELHCCYQPAVMRRRLKSFSHPHPCNERYFQTSVQWLSLSTLTAIVQYLPTFAVIASSSCCVGRVFWKADVACEPELVSQGCWSGTADCSFLRKKDSVLEMGIAFFYWGNWICLCHWQKR